MCICNAVVVDSMFIDFLGKKTSPFSWINIGNDVLVDTTTNTAITNTGYTLLACICIVYLLKGGLFL